VIVTGVGGSVLAGVEKGVLSCIAGVRVVGVCVCIRATVSHFGEHERLHLESSKQNYYIISLRAIIKAIFTSRRIKKIHVFICCLILNDIYIQA